MQITKIAKCGFGQELVIIPIRKIVYPALNKITTPLPELYYCCECFRQLSEYRVDFLRNGLHINNDSQFYCKECQEKIEIEEKKLKNINTSHDNFSANCHFGC